MEEPSMITAIVTAPIPDGFTSETYAEGVKGNVERFRTIPGLVRKNFLFSAEEGLAGGVYLWETREAADACYAEGGTWREVFTSIFGVQPQIRFFDTPVVVDNKVGEIVTAA
jgi:hypothetical protein